MHTPLVYAPDLIAPTYPFGIYEPGMTPDPPGCSSLPYHAADADEHEEGLLPAKTGDEVLEAETGDKALEAETGDEALKAETGDEVLKAEMGGEALEAELPIGALLDEANVCAAAAYEAGVWCELRRGGGQGVTGGDSSRRAWKRRAGADMDKDGAHSMHLRKRRKGMFGVGGYVPVPLAAFEEQDGVRVKSAAMIEDSDSG